MPLNREDVQDLLEAILGSEQVHFQPPSSVQMSYPSIVYKLDNMPTKFGDNNPYILEKRYMVTVIDKDPDSTIPDKLAKLPKSSFNRHFTADNLNHYIFTIYF